MFTHPFQTLLILATMAATVALPLLVGLPMTPHQGAWPVVLTTAAACVIAVVTLHLWIVPLSTRLYLAVLRRTVVTFAEARELSPLFMPNRLGSWFPMRELAEMPTDRRVPHMRAFLAQAREDGIVKPRRRRSPRVIPRPAFLAGSPLSPFDTSQPGTMPTGLAAQHRTD